jgi:sugar O-acyltransferase (sialic acid O-acetyltransferase NeuD family)
MKKVIIYGAGGFGREVHRWAEDFFNVQSDLKFYGFLDDGTDLSEFPELKEYYLGKGAEWKFSDDQIFIVALGLVDAKRKVVQFLSSHDADFLSFVHPSAVIGSRVELGVGNIICPGCIFTTDVIIGDHNLFNLYTTVGHDVVIGSFNVFGAHNDITGNVNIGDNNFFGSRVSILPGKTVGSNNKVSAGSVLFRNIKDNMMVMGNPANSFK